jgi:hypothetical protein
MSQSPFLPVRSWSPFPLSPLFSPSLLGLVGVMESRYPKDGSAYMNEYGPTDPNYRITNGKLLYNPKRDARFPYIYEITNHVLVHSPQYIKKILIHVVDTAEEARVARAQFQATLSVPLGPNALMTKYGQ